MCVEFTERSGKFTDEQRAAMTPGELRDIWISNDDVRRIVQKHRKNTTQLDKDEGISVQMWLIKAQRDLSKNGSCMEVLNLRLPSDEKKWVLAFFTPWQRRMALESGNVRCLCLYYVLRLCTLTLPTRLQLTTTSCGR
jgi:hypothetical protein